MLAQYPDCCESMTRSMPRWSQKLPAFKPGAISGGARHTLISMRYWWQGRTSGQHYPSTHQPSPTSLSGRNWIH